MKIVDLVDSIEYTQTNCFAHQLYKSLHSEGDVTTVPLSDIGSHPVPDRVICRLKQRTLHRVMDDLRSWCGTTPVVIFDQDPWHAYMDDSPYKGVYDRACETLNVSSIAVTTRHWASKIKNTGLPSTFVSMWVLPEYCDRSLLWLDRPISVGFIGSMHPHRKRTFDELDELDVQVNVQAGNTLPYQEYLRALGSLRVFIHSEDCPIIVDGQPANLSDSLWIKDVEAAARGCFTIRNRGEDSGSYYDGIETVRLYDSLDEVPKLLRDIENMDPQVRQDSIDRSVEFIKRSNKWHETAKTLVGLA